MPWSAPLVGPGLCIDLRRPTDLSWSLRFDTVDDRPFGLPPARTRAFEGGSFVGDVRRGGSCNCETHTITPHGDGTHTEGIGHLLKERVPVGPLMTDALVPALFVSVTPARLDAVTDDVSGNHAPDDRVVDQLSLEEAIARARKTDPSATAARALIVRTQAPRARHSENPVYFTVDAALAVRECGFDHVLVDLPSLDRADDGGLLAAHRAFFDLPARATSIDGPPPHRTVTELCAIPLSLTEGVYALALQLAPIEADAVPSRPLLFPLVRAALGFGARPPVPPPAPTARKAKHR